jgi:hypothetical protein
VASGRNGWPALLFFRGVLQGGLSSSVGQEASDELVGELAETQVDLLLKGGKAGGILSQPLSPALLLLVQLGVDVLHGLRRRWDGIPGLGLEAEEHQMVP